MDFRHCRIQSGRGAKPCTSLRILLLGDQREFLPTNNGFDLG